MLNFLGIGAQKAATTWLYEHLSRHPNVSFPAGKEVHFWDQSYDRGVPWYRSLFESSDNSVKGEITPSYALLTEERIREIYSLSCHLRIVYLIRNPIERAWSAALMALQRAEMAYDEASDQWFIDHFRSAGSLRRGNYEACLRRWRSVYPDNQLLVQRYEHISRAPRLVLKRCAEHIGVDSCFYERIDEAALRLPVFVGTRERIRPSLYAVLREIYEPQILRLEQYLGEDLTDWKAHTRLAELRERAG
jgi:hypothetical protein